MLYKKYFSIPLKVHRKAYFLQVMQVHMLKYIIGQRQVGIQILLYIQWNESETNTVLHPIHLKNAALTA